MQGFAELIFFLKLLVRNSIVVSNFTYFWLMKK